MFSGSNCHTEARAIGRTSDLSAALEAGRWYDKKAEKILASVRVRNKLPPVS